MTTFTSLSNTSGASPAYILAFTYNGNSYSLLIGDNGNNGLDSGDLETTLENMSATLGSEYTNLSLSKVEDTESSSVIYTPPSPDILVSLTNSTFSSSVSRTCDTNDQFNLYVKLSEDPGADVTVTLTQSPNESRLYINESLSAATLTFTPGDWDTSQSVSVMTSVSGIHNIGDSAGYISCTADTWTGATASFTWGDS